MADFYIKQNDTLPVFVFICKNAAGDPVDLSGTTLTFHMRPQAGGAIKINAAATPDPDQVTNKGQGSYIWRSDRKDTGTASDFDGDVEVTYPDLSSETFPNEGYFLIHIESQLG